MSVFSDVLMYACALVAGMGLGSYLTRERRERLDRRRKRFSDRED